VSKKSCREIAFYLYLSSPTFGACYYTTGYPSKVETLPYLATPNAFAEAEKERKLKNHEKTPFFVCSTHVFCATDLNNVPTSAIWRQSACDFTGAVSQQPLFDCAPTGPPDVQLPSRGGGCQ